MEFQFPRMPTVEQRKEFRKSVYSQLAKDYQADVLRFMNYGFLPDAGSVPITLDASEEKFRCQIQLYDYMVRQVELEGKNVLEVGCGRGGGAAYVARTMRPGSYTGLDMTHGALMHGKSGNTLDNLRFVVGDAENLPFPEAVFDVVLNVESSHCYHPIEKFLSGVHRILAPGGYLLLTDFRDLVGVAELRRALFKSGLTLLKETNISKNVFAAIKQESPERIRAIVRHASREFWPFLQEFGATHGSRLYEALENDSARYMSYLLQKQ